MAKRAGRALGDFKDLVFPEGYVPGAGKRKVGSVEFYFNISQTGV